MNRDTFLKFLAFLALIFVLEKVFLGFEVVYLLNYFLLAIALVFLNASYIRFIKFFTLKPNIIVKFIFFTGFAWCVIFLFDLFMNGFSITQGGFGGIVTKELKIGEIEMSRNFLMLFISIIFSLYNLLLDEII